MRCWSGTSWEGDAFGGLDDLVHVVTVELHAERGGDAGDPLRVLRADDRHRRGRMGEDEREGDGACDRRRSRSARASITPSSSGVTPSPVASAPPASGLQASGTTPVCMQWSNVPSRIGSSRSRRELGLGGDERKRKVGRQRFDLGDRVVRDADLADLAGVTQLGERFGDVGGMAVQVGTVDLVEVDHVDLQAAQRRLARGPEVLRLTSRTESAATMPPLVASTIRSRTAAMPRSRRPRISST